jgi:hypothetical protein
VILRESSPHDEVMHDQELRSPFTIPDSLELGDFSGQNLPLLFSGISSCWYGFLTLSRRIVRDRIKLEGVSSAVLIPELENRTSEHHYFTKLDYFQPF